MPQALLLDQYSLTMGQFFFKRKMNDRVSFELFVRSLPSHRGYLVVAGLGTALWALRQLHFSIEDIDYLRAQRQFPLEPQPVFDGPSWENEPVRYIDPPPLKDNPRLYDEDFLQYLHDLDLSLDIFAMPEGTIAFPHEPMLRVTGPRIEATLVESLLLSIINHQTMVASKASRIVTAAEGKEVWDFSLRRLHGPEASIGVARASYIAGAAGTATVEAGRILKIPTTGTMAHAQVMAYGEGREKDCFIDVLKLYPYNHAILPDTFDTERGIHRAVQASIETNIPLLAIRIDSDLEKSIPMAKSILDGARYAKSWFMDTKLVASNDLDEYSISKLNLPIDSYGVGTMLGTSADAPHLGGVYKLVEQTREPRWVMKLTEGKQTDPGRHQVWRYPLMGDVITLASEDYTRYPLPDNWPAPLPLLREVMRDGRLAEAMPSLSDSREYHREQRIMMDPEVLHITAPKPYQVNRSKKLWELRASLGDEEAGREIARRELEKDT